MREHFDVVLIDSPSATAVSDAVVLAVQCDWFLLVLRAYKAPPMGVQRVIDRLEAVRGRILTTVLVGVDFRDPDFSDYHHYYSSSY